MNQENEPDANARAATALAVWAGLSKPFSVAEIALTPILGSAIRSLPAGGRETMILATLAVSMGTGISLDLWAYRQRRYCATWQATKIIDKMGGKHVFWGILLGTFASYLFENAVNPISNAYRLSADPDLICANFLVKGGLGIAGSLAINTAIRRDTLDPLARKITDIENRVAIPLNRFNLWLGETTQPFYPDQTAEERERREFFRERIV